MKKLLHERLRRLTDDDACFVCADNFEASISRKAGEHLADEIERYYIPRPRFEDGEPINRKNAPNGEDSMIMLLDGTGYSLGYVTDQPFNTMSTPIKRPSPKVLDADGVEIKEDETVWCIDTGTKLNVISIDIKDGTVLCDNDFIYDPDVLTHKEPDSLEKLRDEIANFDDLGYQYRPQLHKKWADRLSALIEKEK